MNPGRFGASTTIHHTVTSEAYTHIDEVLTIISPLKVTSEERGSGRIALVTLHLWKGGCEGSTSGKADLILSALWHSPIHVLFVALFGPVKDEASNGEGCQRG